MRIYIAYRRLSLLLLGQSATSVELEEDDIAILYFVVLSLCAILPSTLHGSLRPVLLVIIILHHLRESE